MPSVNFDACIFLLVFCLVCTCIYGYECNDGRYGQDCELRCGACLGNKTCHHINGSCPEGCDAGYRGDLCKTECSPSTYGFSCLNNCSLSCINFTCHHITGACTIIGTSQRFSDPPPDSTLQIIIGGLGAGYLLIVLVVIGFLLRIWNEEKAAKRKRKERNEINHFSVEKENYLSVIHITSAESGSSEYEELGDRSLFSNYQSLK